MAGPLASNMLKNEKMTDRFFLFFKKPWGQRSAEDHGAVGEWITPRIWIEVGTGPLAENAMGVKKRERTAKNAAVVKRHMELHMTLSEKYILQLKWVVLLMHFFTKGERNQ